MVPWTLLWYVVRVTDSANALKNQNGSAPRGLPPPPSPWPHSRDLMCLRMHLATHKGSRGGGGGRVLEG